MECKGDCTDSPLLPYELTDDKHNAWSGHSPPPKYALNRECALQQQTGHSHGHLSQRLRLQSAIILTSILSCIATTLVLVVVGWLILQGDRNAIHFSIKHPFIYDEYYNITNLHATGCGSTVEEAIARDCRFDELADLWLPQKCSRAFEAEYLRANKGGPAVYWTSPDGKDVISDRSRYAGGPTYYSTTRDHLVHCEYNFYRFADSLKTGALLGHSDGFAGHMHHCAQMLGKFANQADNLDKIDVDTVSTFGFC